MANRSRQEEIHNGCINFNMVKLPPDRKQALHELECHIKTVFDTYSADNNNQSVTKFYIGKSSVPCSERFKFDICNPHDTWEHRRIQSRWSEHRKGYTTMVVIAVITDDSLPEGIRYKVGEEQNYCLSLECELINRFKYEIEDDRIANDTSNAGYLANEYDTLAYVLYVVMKLAHQPHEQGLNSSSRRKNCGKCSECLAADCGHCKHCEDMPKFGGPGIKKQRCMKKQCSNKSQSPLESSSHQFNGMGRNLASTNTHENKQRYNLESTSTLKDASRNDHGRSSEIIAITHEDSRSKTKSIQSSLHTQGSPKSTKSHKHEQKYTSKSSSEVSEICLSGSRTATDQKHNPMPNLQHAQERSVLHSNNVSRSIFILSSKCNGHTACVDDEKLQSLKGSDRYNIIAKSSHSSQSSWPLSTRTHEHKQKHTLESTSSRIKPRNFMPVDDRETYQHKHLQSDGRPTDLQARMQIVESERKVEARTSPISLASKRSSSFADMQLPESQDKRCKVDHNNTVVTSSHLIRAGDPVPTKESEHTSIYDTYKRQDRPTLNRLDSTKAMQC